MHRNGYEYDYVFDWNAPASTKKAQTTRSSIVTPVKEESKEPKVMPGT